MKQKLKLALVGAGERGQYCYAPYAKMHGYEIEFVAVADPHKGRREKFVQDYHVPAEGVFETAEQFFARPRMADAVLICTQDSQHYARPSTWGTASCWKSPSRPVCANAWTCSAAPRKRARRSWSAM